MWREGKGCGDRVKVCGYSVKVCGYRGKSVWRYGEKCVEIG